MDGVILNRSSILIPTTLHIPILKLKKSSPLNTILYEVVKDFGFTPHQLTEVVHLLDGEQGSYIQSSSHRIIKKQELADHCSQGD